MTDEANKEYRAKWSGSGFLKMLIFGENESEKEYHIEYYSDKILKFRIKFAI